MPAKLVFFVVLILATASLSSCKKMTQGKDNSENAVVEFHQRFNDQKFKEIYAAGNAAFKAAESEEDFVTLLAAMHHKLGRHVKPGDTSWRYSSINGKSIVMITHPASYEHGKAVETFIYSLSGESSKLERYHIESRDMMIK